MSIEAKHIAFEQGFFDERYPVCPVCDEFAYSLDKCVFCGTPFIQDEAIARLKKPPREVRYFGYTAIQASNNHIHIYDASSGQLVSHIQCNRKLPNNDIVKMIKNTIALMRST